MLKWIKSKLRTEHIVPDVMLIYLVKLIYHRVTPRQKKQTLLFIVGCQRSGTSLMNRIFSRDLRVSVYREASKLSSTDQPKKLRLNPLDEVQQEFERNKAPIIVLKPLVESQNILQLLDYFPQSKALWMYRHYKDTAISLISRFGLHASLRDIKFIVENNRSRWHVEGVSDYVRSVVMQHFSEDMSPYDAAALFWFARNQLFYELNLDHNPRVLMGRYEDLATNPGAAIGKIYQFLGSSYPEKNNLIQEVKATSVGRGHKIELSPAVEQLCAELLERLEQTYSSQSSSSQSSSLQSATVSAQPDCVMSNSQPA
jgi:Sulfotransferase domain